MRVEILNNYNERNIVQVKSENELMKKIGEFFLESFNDNLNNSVKIEAYNQDLNSLLASFEFKGRGSFLDKEGNKIPSMHCMKSYYVGGLPRTPYKTKELRCINLLGNNYKKYILCGTETSDLDAKYGSIDVPLENCRNVKYESYMYWILFYEKLSKGYVDCSNVFKNSIKVEGEKISGSSNPKNANEELYKVLYDFSNGVVQSVLVSQIVTVKQCQKARKLFEELKEKKTVKGFNTQLSKLMLISPRKRDPFAGDKIADYSAKSIQDFESIIDFEETLLLSMETVAGMNSVEEEKASKTKSPSFLSQNIEVYETTKEQKEIVMKHLNYSLQQKVKKVYRVIPNAQNKKFNDYCKDNNINNVKLLWHGSPNGNWFSILTNSLKITKNAAHGRMFGDGIYFAPSADKSWGYTSSYGSRWANGNSSQAIMGLYATAYGTPYMVNTWGSSYENEASIKRKGCNCLHATPSNTGLRADEIIYYNENAVCLNYIVIFG